MCINDKSYKKISCNIKIQFSYALSIGDKNETIKENQVIKWV